MSLVGIASLLAGPLLGAPAAAAPVGTVSGQQPRSCAQLAAEGAAELGIDYRSFDQVPDRGWRRLRTAGCNGEAIALIQRYLAANQHRLLDSQRANLNFHAAQIALDQGRTGVAISFLDRATIEADTSAGPLDWNAYVRATQAFAARDRAAFDRDHGRLVKRRFRDPQCSGGSICLRPDGNAPVVERLRRCWDRPYRIAYYEC